MSAWGKRQNRSNPQGARLGFESLERREMLSGNYVFTLTSGNTVSFTDADGTKVKVKLMGSGSGSFTLTNGLSTGAPIASMSINGTNGASQLKITASGGADDASTIRSLTVTPASGGKALQQLDTTAINVASGGLLTFNGSVGSISLDNVNHGASIVVNGGVKAFSVSNSIGSNASIDVTGTLTSMRVQNLGGASGPAQVSAGVLSALTVTSQMNNAVVESGADLASIFIGSAVNSTVFAGGGIGSILVQGNITNSNFASNRSPGSDDILGTLDDYTIAPSTAKTITAATFNGTVSGVQLISTNQVGTVSGSGAAAVDVVDNAISQFIPLQIAQAAASITGFDDDEIWIAVFGQEIVTPKEGVIPPTGISYYLDATNLNGSGASARPIPISTATLPVSPDTPDQAILPSFTLAQWKNAAQTWGSNLQFPVPAAGNQYTGRILISVGVPVQAQITGAQYTVAAPSAASAIDPSNGTFYDFLEFTVTNNPSLTNPNGIPNLDMDTSQVDSFGLPMTLQFFQNSAGTTPFNVVFNGVVTSGSNTITGISNADIANLQIGQPIVASGVIPAGALIDQITTSPNTIVLSKNASASSPISPGYTSLTAQNAGPVGVDAKRDDLLDPANSSSLTQFLQNKLGAGHDHARAFLQSAAPYQTTAPIPITGATLSSGTLTITTDSVEHLAPGAMVAIYGVGGIPTANGVYAVATVNLADGSFTVTGVSGSGGYTQGGVWQLAITGASMPGPGNAIQISASSVAGLNNGDLIQIVNLAGMTAANGFFFVENVDTTSNTFTLADSDGTGQTFTPASGAGVVGGTWTKYVSNLRVVSPDDIVANLPAPTSPNQLNNYYNALIDEFFLTYLPSSQSVLGSDGITRTGGGATLSISSNVSGSPITYSGTVQNLGSGANGGYALILNGMLNSTPTTFAVYYPFSTANSPSQDVYRTKFPVAAPPTWLVEHGLQFSSASEMIFGCSGVFADNAFRAKEFKKTNVKDWSATLGDLESSIASAFNRGIALNNATTWSDRSTWFQQTAAPTPPAAPSRPASSQASELYGVYNYWVEYWHQNGIAVNDLAYAYPYDDKYGTSTNLQQNGVGLAQVLLNQWSATQTIDTTTTFGDASQNPAVPPVVPANPTQGGSVTLTTTVQANAGTVSPTGTVTFFIDGVPINTNNFGATPPLQPVTLVAGPASSGYSTASLTAHLPALPDGSLNRTYTVTAVYSGDATNEPSIASMPLKLTGVNGDFLMTSPTSGTLTPGSQIIIAGTLPGGVYNGTLVFSLNGTPMGTINIGGANFSTTVTIPTPLATGYYSISGLFTPLSGGPYTGVMGINVTG